jgi:predicted porin
MKKTLISLAIAGLPLVAMADVTLYGNIKMGVETSMVDGTATQGEVNRTNIDDLGSYIGFKGTEDLGGDLKAMWQVETRLSIDSATNGANGQSFGTLRDSFVGLESASFGSLQVGVLSNFANQEQGVLDIWEYAQSTLGLAAYTSSQDRYDHAVRYMTPVMGGFQGFVQYGQQEAQAGEIVTETNGFDQANRSFNAGLSYSIANVKMTYGYEDINYTEFAGRPHDTLAQQNHLAEVVYSANGLMMGVGYNDQKISGETIDNVHQKQVVFSTSYDIGSFTPKFSYAHGFGDVDYDQYILGADYSLSKRTVVGLQYGLVNGEGLVYGGGSVIDMTDAQSVGVNVVHKF